MSWLGCLNLCSHWLSAQEGIGSGEELFYCVRVPCPEGLVLKKLFLPYELGCCIHFVWQ